MGGSGKRAALAARGGGVWGTGGLNSLITARSRDGHAIIRGPSESWQFKAKPASKSGQRGQDHGKGKGDAAHGMLHFLNCLVQPK